MKTSLLTGAALALALSLGAAASANAADYVFNYTSSDPLGVPLTATIDFTVADAVTFGTDGHLITGASGTVDGNAISLVSTSPPGQLQTNCCFNWDNILFVDAQPHLSNNGVLLSSLTDWYNFYATDPSSLAVANGNGTSITGIRETINTGGTQFLSTGAATLTAVPEPTSWALMILGFGGIGSILRSKRRDKPVSSLTTAA